MNRFPVNPTVMHWARERAQLEIESLVARFPKLPEWESGEVLPTFKQLEDYAKATHVPFGYLFLPETPEIPLPIRDFRTVKNQHLGSVSPDLLDTIHAMQRRQAWLREARRECDAEREVAALEALFGSWMQSTVLDSLADVGAR